MSLSNLESNNIAPIMPSHQQGFGASLGQQIPPITSTVGFPQGQAAGVGSIQQLSDTFKADQRLALMQMQEAMRDTIFAPSGTNFWGNPRSIIPASREHGLKKHSKAAFALSNAPIIKDIMSGLVKLSGEEIKNRIKEHLER